MPKDTERLLRVEIARERLVSRSLNAISCLRNREYYFFTTGNQSSYIKFSFGKSACG